MSQFTKHIPSIVLGLVGGAFLTAAGVAVASRNAAGTDTNVNGPYVAGTTINSTLVNARFADAESEITNSLDRNGRGGMLAALRGTDGTAAAPALSFTSETGTGLYRIGAGDLGVSVSGAKLVDWNSVAGGAAETLTLAGSASVTAAGWFAGSLADGNVVNLRIGKAVGAGLNGVATYTKNATAANSTFCLGVDSGSNSTFCVDGNAKTYIGSTGTGISQINTGVGTFNGGSTATFTATVASGAKCVATRDAVGGAAGVSAAVSGTTLTVTSTVSLDTHTATWICF